MNNHTLNNDDYLIINKFEFYINTYSCLSQLILQMNNHTLEKIKGKNRIIHVMLTGLGTASRLLSGLGAFCKQLVACPQAASHLLSGLALAPTNYNIEV